MSLSLCCHPLLHLVICLPFCIKDKTKISDNNCIYICTIYIHFILDVNVSRTPPLSTHVTNRGTPPTPGKSQERRGSLSKHSPSMSKAGNMVSYEDMIRNSPRNTPKMTRNKPSTPTTPRKSQAINAFEAVKPVKPGTPVISPKKPPTGEAASPKVTEEVKLRHSK